MNALEIFVFPVESLISVEYIIYIHIFCFGLLAWYWIERISALQNNIIGAQLPIGKGNPKKKKNLFEEVMRDIFWSGEMHKNQKEH